ncbi:unnamed protein product [Symbiodinium pilosum]|uniref:Uncharacterized protein n=1 Tax=Symbiodinium pilosum TaxID=2952 RepID=A0A812WB12_SYMPI|nr:unnamed protein product [Symbiodinium pilosum]
MVVIRFDSNRKIWKRVPFVEVRKFGDGTLRPLWKKTEVATVPERPKDFVDIDDDEASADNAPVVDAEASKATVLIGSPEEEPPKDEPSTKRKDPAAGDKDAKAAKKRKT